MSDFFPDPSNTPKPEIALLHCKIPVIPTADGWMQCNECATAFEPVDSQYGYRVSVESTMQLRAQLPALARQDPFREYPYSNTRWCDCGVSDRNASVVGHRKGCLWNTAAKAFLNDIKNGNRG